MTYRIGRLLAFVLLPLFLGACAQLSDDLDLFAGGEPIYRTADGVEAALEGATISGVVEVELPMRSRWVRSVTFYLDGAPGRGVEVARLEQRPFSFELDAHALTDGAHSLVAVVVAAKSNRERIRLYDYDFFVGESVNGAPTVDAGPDLTTSTSTTTALAGAVTDDSATASLSVLWRLQSGPGSVDFADASAAQTSAMFGASGRYVLELSADDGEYVATDVVAVDVEGGPGGDPSPPAPSVGDFELRGDPDFDPSSLPSDARLWYDRVVSAFDHPDPVPDVMGSAASGDLYLLGRTVNRHVTTVLTLFRVTGDLALLDEVDRIMQAARGGLSDTNGDGYLNWRWLHNSGSSYYGRDDHKMDEILTHSLVAVVAWAFENNRDLVSPSGVSYSERAEFWTDYLVDHWIAKWRDRSNTSGYRFIRSTLQHPYVHQMRIHWYAYRITGDGGFLTEAERRAAIVNDHELRAVSTSAGQGFVWAHGVIGEGSPYDTMQHTNYSTYTAQALLDLSFEPFEPFDLGTHAPRIANAISAFVVDNGATDFDRSIGGSTAQAGLSVPSGSRPDNSQWAHWPLALYAPWDSTGELVAVAEQVYDIRESANTPRRISMAASIVMSELLGN